jgi:hypothetical protein
MPSIKGVLEWGVIEYNTAQPNVAQPFPPRSILVPVPGDTRLKVLLV